MSPEELQVLDSTIKIGLGGLIGVITSALGGLIAYKTANANSKAKLVEKSHENNEIILKECVLHINHYHSNLSQYLYHIEQIFLLAGAELSNTALMEDQHIEREKISKLLFNEGNREVDLAAAKILFIGADSAYTLIRKYDEKINRFYKDTDYSLEDITRFRSGIEAHFVETVKEISKFRG
jgi:hypothetical protein